MKASRHTTGRLLLITRYNIFFVITMTMLLFNSNARSGNLCIEKERPSEKQIDAEWLLKELPQDLPRLFLNPRLGESLRTKIISDSLVMDFVHLLRRQSQDILTNPLLQRNIYDGRRMLGISREVLRRISILGMVYQIDQSPALLERIDAEINNVCSYSDWNPPHFLDVAEMALAVSIGLDLTAGQLPEKTIVSAKNALIEKAIMPGFDSEFNGWVNNNNNWNQVCHGGLVAAALTIAHDQPELAARVINRALANIHHAMDAYGPDGIYPEGVTYWGYGTAYTIMLISMLENAFGHDFAIGSFTGFMESPVFVMLMTAPSGEFFNFFDTQSNFRDGYRGLNDENTARFNNPDLTVCLSWFASKTGHATYLDPSYFRYQSPDRQRSRFDPIALSWLLDFEPSEPSALPTAWHGKGLNPLAIFRDEGQANSPQSGFYLGTKGGQASISHGHMDAGSFILEWHGVRWSVDPGIQAYAPLEQSGLSLWDRSQESGRWSLLTTGSHGHSTLIINEQMHNADGYATIIDFHDGSNGQASVSYDLTHLFSPNAEKAIRTFIREGPGAVRIDDHITLNSETRSLTWQMITEAEIETFEQGLLLKQDNEVLELRILSPEGANASIISLDPPPLQIDKRIDKLKKISIKIPAWYFELGQARISVLLSARKLKTSE